MARVSARMHNPPHPGEILQDTVLSAGISVTEFARRLGVSRVTLSRVINGRAAVSADMALRLAAARSEAAPNPGYRCRAPMISGKRKPSAAPGSSRSDS